MGVHDVVEDLVDAPLLRFRSASHQPPFLLRKANGPRDRRNHESLIFYSMPHGLKRSDCYLPWCYRWSRIVEHKVSWAVLDLGIAIDGHRKM
jgi:hypothetical protein